MSKFCACRIAAPSVRLRGALLGWQIAKSVQKVLNDSEMYADPAERLSYVEIRVSLIKQIAR